MKPTVFPSRSAPPLRPLHFPKSQSLHFRCPSNPNDFLRFNHSSSSLNSLSFPSKFKPSDFRFIVCSLKSSPIEGDARVELNQSQEGTGRSEFNFEVRNAAVPLNLPPAKLSLSDQAFFLMAFIACTTCVAFVGLVAAAVPTLFAMSRAAISLSKLADTAREELPSTMAAIRLSGMEISDLTLELSDLSQEIADGVKKSGQAVQAAGAGIQQIGSMARQQTMSMIEERANLPVISFQPVVAGAAKKTTNAVGQATRRFLNMISRSEHSSENDDGNALDRLEV